MIGSYQRPVGNDFMVAISQTCVSRCIHEVIDAINCHLADRYIKFPNDDEWFEIKRRYL